MAWSKKRLQSEWKKAYNNVNTDSLSYIIANIILDILAVTLLSFGTWLVVRWLGYPEGLVGGFVPLFLVIYVKHLWNNSFQQLFIYFGNTILKKQASAAIIEINRLNEELEKKEAKVMALEAEKEKQQHYYELEQQLAYVQATPEVYASFFTEFPIMDEIFKLHCEGMNRNDIAVALQEAKKATAAQAMWLTKDNAAYSSDGSLKQALKRWKDKCKEDTK